jgi:hypothetical protein
VGGTGAGHCRAEHDIVLRRRDAGNTGILRLGATGTGAFAVASVNVGLGATMTVTADTGTAVLPVTLAVCQTNPGTGACMVPPASSVDAFIDGGATPTFAVFGQSSAAVPFNPAVNRVFVRFKDALGVTRGATSVAVTADLP